MARTAQALRRKAVARKPLPALLAFTDPQRTPDVEAMARALPRGTALVYRAFGAPDAQAAARRLKAICRARGLILLIGADASLAARAGADGVHLPERLAHRAPALRRTYPHWLVTAAAHGPRATRVRADAVVVSAIFPSASPSAGKPIGTLRLAQVVRGAASPVYALGGINDKTARRLLSTGVIGIAAVESLRT
ncbi:thiamine phosphate synthase [Phenylobacterium aquaticum]|uniref:thiamine phosphate synthase n=1 Tax=Phenylobacterium aquaticum TaxID=1763816 RepID=UPI0026EF4FF9|nr:thiamine phosphate synthase [Phenylobacterium aquaticum]